MIGRILFIVLLNVFSALMILGFLSAKNIKIKNEEMMYQLDTRFTILHQDLEKLMKDIKTNIGYKMIDRLKAKTLELRKARSPLGPTMQFHVAEVSKIGKSKNRETTEDEAIQYIKKTVQRLNEDEYADKLEIAVLEELLPQMATEAEVREFLSTIDTSNKGAVMKAVRDKYGALVDMKMVGGLL
jgi:uncharacterized protein YqeY